MTARWDRLPPKARVKKPRRAPGKASWRCVGVRGCGAVLTSWAGVDRHGDETGHARFELVIALRSDATTEGEHDDD